MGDNGRQSPPMNSDDTTREPASGPPEQPPGAGRGLRAIARRVLWRFAPAYASRRAGRGELAAKLARLEADFDHLATRHAEQIERLEDLVRELILAVESLRRAAPSHEPREEE